jgi:Bifunctional DNA primase/polymerase, N-terminal/Primase C terminal 1 (PriCT-1)
MNQPASPLLNTALALADRGLAVFPCRPRDKRPAVRNGVHEGTTDQGLIREWWQCNPEYNIGVVTGAISGIFVVDLDGSSAHSALAKLEFEYGELPHTIEVITARGRHKYFHWPARPLRNSTSKIGPGIDIKADGGYVLAPPSVHPSGRRYCWLVNGAREFAPAPEWLLDQAQAAATTTGTCTPASHWQRLLANPIIEGTRDNSLAKLAGYLLRHRIDPQLTLELLQSVNITHCTPALSSEDVTRIVNSIAGKELQRRHSHG